MPRDAGFLVIAEADGTEAEAQRIRDELADVFSEGALSVVTPPAADLWRWRDGVSLAVAAALGGKVIEDIVVPVDRLAEAVEATIEIGARHGLEAVSWGHGGDGNLHSTFLVAKDDADALASAEHAADELFATTLSLSGSISGEHGLGVAKRGRAGWTPPVERIQLALKATLDPKGLFNPAKKL